MILRPFHKHLSPGRLLWLLPAAFCLGLALFSCWYLLLDYGRLRDWYFSLSPCLFEKQKWTALFFTPAVKAAGNRWCVAGIPVGLVLTAVFIREAFQSESSVYAPMVTRRRDGGWMVVAALCSLAASYWGCSLLAPANDEVFSAMHSAATHPFRAWSYYMAPNNHVLFNTLNALLAGWQNDLVASGRMISALCAAATACCMFCWLRPMTGSALLTFGATLLLSLQLYGWGFGFQARGYALCSLAEWLSLLALWRYLEGGEKRHQRWLALASATGFAVLPSFLYWYAALMLLAAAVQFGRRRLDRAFWAAQLAMAACVFLFYLPLLCFSGLSSLAENRYVVAVPVSFPKFLDGFLIMAQHYPYAIFSGVLPEGHWLGYALMAVPLLLLFARGRYRRAAVFGVLLWINTACIILAMRHPPFARNLAGHFSLTLALCCVALIAGLRRMLGRWQQWIVAAGLTLMGVAAALFVWSGKEIVATELYGNDVNASFERLREGTVDIPPGSTVGLSDGAFPFLYPLRARRLPVHFCYDGTENFIIAHEVEPFSMHPLPGYVLMRKLEDYQIWQRTSDAASE